MTKDENLRLSLAGIVAGSDTKNQSEQEVEDGEEHGAILQSARSERESRLCDPFRLSQPCRIEL